MTDKEQIIIDGANILDCDNYYVEQETDQVKCALSGEYCRENKNCFYKQLARKTQECEELKKKLRELELKNTTLQNRCQQLDGSMVKADRYRKALEEVETVTKINCEEICGRKFADCKDTSCFSVNILDIINKAKGEGNGN